MHNGTLLTSKPIPLEAPVITHVLPLIVIVLVRKLQQAVPTTVATAVHKVKMLAKVG
jgi:hypothetical protein